MHLNACDCVRHQVAVLSGGEKRRVALARLLLENHDMLLLDEPTNHLDAQSVAWLQTYLNDFPGTVVAITHDRYFLEETCKWILELERGEGKPDCMLIASLIRGSEDQRYACDSSLCAGSSLACDCLPHQVRCSIRWCDSSPCAGLTLVAKSSGAPT